ncbi:UDP-N-acetylglucosamine 2-epimerase (non-hydrolyzing) [Bacteroidota bacterium]
MKVAPVIEALEKRKTESSIEWQLVHTGQHYDARMSETFFQELGIPEPHANLECGGGSQAEQTAAILIAFEKYLLKQPADLVLVVGDVTSTMACTLVAKKLGIAVGHIEAGIRSGDMEMPEEINRMVTDSICDYFYTTTTWAGENLLKTGIPEQKIVFVGNVMIDTLLKNRPRFKAPAFFEESNLRPGNYLVLTLHRPSNVDDSAKLRNLIEAIASQCAAYTLVFPVHPRTRTRLGEDWEKPANVLLTEPLGYLEFNYLVENAKGVITDSGGITEETTVMGIPCITLRNSTERPETVNIGTNELVGEQEEKRRDALSKLLSGTWKKGAIPEKWDGKAAERIVDHLIQLAKA